MLWLLSILRHPAVHSELGLDLSHTPASPPGLTASDDLATKRLKISSVSKVTANLMSCKNDSKLLLVCPLDGWDEAPACLRNPPDSTKQCPPDNSYLGKLLLFGFIQHYHPHHLSTRLLTGPTQQAPPMLTEWRFLVGSPRRAFMTTSRKHCLLSYPLMK